MACFFFSLSSITIKAGMNFIEEAFNQERMNPSLNFPFIR